MEISMSSVQFYLTIGIPTQLSILMDTVQFNATNARLSSMDSRFSAAETRVSNLETPFDARFNNLEVKFDTLIGKIVELDNRVTRIEAKLDIR